MAVLAKLADNELIVYVAYLTYLLPWTLIASIPFITDQWKSVRDTRHDGIMQLILVATPMPYIIFYILLQNASRDYKEMFAASVGLCLSAFHIARTSSALCQIHAFRLWAISSITALHDFGIEYKLNPSFLDLLPCHCDEATSCFRCDPSILSSPEEVVDMILVNNTIVDNQLFHGSAKCYLQYRSIALRLSNNQFRGPVLFRVRRRFGLLVDYIRVFFLFSLHALKARFLEVVPFYKSDFNHRHSIVLVPQDPVELWLRWAVAFAAQGLPTWITNFRVARGAPVYEPIRHTDGSLGHTRTQNIPPQDRRDFFASELLAAASLHLMEGGGGKRAIKNPLLWDVWPMSSAMASGRMSKTEMLEMAIEKGLGLPFSAPQLKMPSNNLDGVDFGMGYWQYRFKLARVREQMPAGFGEEINQFDVEHLEWLTILVSLAAMSRDKMSEGENIDEDVMKREKKRKRGIRTPRTDKMKKQSSGSHTLSRTVEPENGIVRRASWNDVALRNLETQLGFEECVARSESEHRLTSRSMQYMSAFPSASVGVYSGMAGNNSVYRVSELIDLWLALANGGHAQDGTLGRLGWKVDGWQGVPSAQVGSMDLESLSVEERRNLFQSLERRHLEYWRSRDTALGSHEWEDIETVSFMGCSMEYVRRKLEMWAGANLRDQAKVWEPRMDLDARAVAGVRIELSEDLSSELVRAEHADYVMRRGVQVRLVWEIQQALVGEVMNGQSGPEKKEMMLLCILSYPGLQVSVVEEHQAFESWGESVEVETSSDTCMIPLDKLWKRKRRSSVGRSGRRDRPVGRWRVQIRAARGPQDVGVGMGFWVQEERTVVASVALFGGTDLRGDLFKWEWWRDAFEGVLEAAPMADASRSLHGARLALHVSSTRIGDVQCDGDGKAASWRGWRPFRDSFPY